MSRLDPRIPMGVEGITPPDPAQAMQLSDLMAQKDARRQAIATNAQRIKESQQKLEEDQFALKTKKREMEEDDLIKRGFSEAGNDPVKGIERAYQINPIKAAKYQEEYDKHLTATANQRKLEFENHTKASDWIAQNLTALLTNPSQKDFVLKSLVSTGMFDPQDPEESQILQQLSQYDPANPESKQFVEGLLTQNTDRKTQMDLAKAKADAEHTKEQDRLEALRVAETNRHNLAEEAKAKVPTFEEATYQDWLKNNPTTNGRPSTRDDYQTYDAKRRPQPQSATIQITNATQPADGMDANLSDALNRATMNASPPRRLQTFNTVNAMFKRGDIAQARDTIKQAALESEPPAVQNTVRGRREVLKSLGAIEGILKDIPTNLLVGTVEQVARKLGTSSDKRLVDLGTRLMTLNQSYRKGMTGAQFSQKEAEEYSSIFPSFSNTPPVNAATIASLKNAFADNDSVFWDNKLGAGWADKPSTLAAQSGPPKGTVVNGFEFLGGDPNVEKNWKKVAK